jgi:D-3-phosphoglycerate dehydrogenase / 2-oxoglutarate reductase
MKVLITTVPFGSNNIKPLDILDKSGVDYHFNPLNRKLQEGELAEIISDFDIVIAGTEIIDEAVFKKAKNLKFISRVGIGLDGIDLACAKEHGVRVSFTPDAPSTAVAELTIGLMISSMRGINQTDAAMKVGKWDRCMGVSFSDLNIGIIGFGRIGKLVSNHLHSFCPKNVLVNDILALEKSTESMVIPSSKEQIYETCDLISLHLPLTADTFNLIGEEELLRMKDGVRLINTARGGIINEEALCRFLTNGHVAAAAIDTFHEEPYSGSLTGFPNVINTAHIGAMTRASRADMEINATEEVLRFIRGEYLLSEIPAYI